MTNEISLDAELKSLTLTLSEHGEERVRSVFEGSHLRCTDEITTFSLEKVLDIQPVSNYGRGGARHYFIDSQSTAAELRRYKKFCDTRAACESSYQQAVMKFSFTYTGVRGSLCRLQTILENNQTRWIAHDALIDYLYIPIYDDPLFPGDMTTHCSMLVFFVRRNQVVLFDTMQGATHQGVARSVVGMIVAAGLAEPHRLHLIMPITKQQRGLTECGWCALIFARWWRYVATAETDAREVLDVNITDVDIVELARSILQQQEQCKQLSLYHDRLRRAFSVLEGRASNVPRPRKKPATTSATAAEGTLRCVDGKLR